MRHMNCWIDVSNAGGAGLSPVLADVLRGGRLGEAERAGVHTGKVPISESHEAGICATAVPSKLRFCREI